MTFSYRGPQNAPPHARNCFAEMGRQLKSKTSFIRDLRLSGRIAWCGAINFLSYGTYPPQSVLRIESTDIAAELIISNELGLTRFHNSRLIRPPRFPFHLKSPPVILVEKRNTWSIVCGIRQQRCEHLPAGPFSAR